MRAAGLHSTPGLARGKDSDLRKAYLEQGGKFPRRNRQLGSGSASSALPGQIQGSPDRIDDGGVQGHARAPRSQIIVEKLAHLGRVTEDTSGHGYWYAFRALEQASNYDLRQTR